MKETQLAATIEKQLCAKTVILCSSHINVEKWKTFHAITSFANLITLKLAIDFTGNQTKQEEEEE